MAKHVKFAGLLQHFSKPHFH